VSSFTHPAPRAVPEAGDGEPVGSVGGERRAATHVTTPATNAHHARPLLGLRRQPGRIALMFMRLPRPLYHRGWGRFLGDTFLLIAHQGRKTGKRRETVAMALTHDPATGEAVVCSAWGPNTEWLQNLRAHPALEIEIGRERYVPEQRFLAEDEAVAVALAFRRRHPWRLRLFATILGWGDLSSEQAMRELVHGRPFVAFRPSTRCADGRASSSRSAARAVVAVKETPAHARDH
jgi:deazaflavin-dependent oxidoreductase (nitroreductase family)